MRAIHLVPLLWILVLVLPYVFYRLLTKLRKDRALGWGKYETWKTEYFDEKGRCKDHPGYDGLTWPEDPDCDGCAVIHAVRPSGEDR